MQLNKNLILIIFLLITVIFINYINNKNRYENKNIENFQNKKGIEDSILHYCYDTKGIQNTNKIYYPFKDVVLSNKCIKDCDKKETYNVKNRKLYQTNTKRDNYTCLDKHPIVDIDMYKARRIEGKGELRYIYLENSSYPNDITYNEALYKEGPKLYDTENSADTVQKSTLFGGKAYFNINSRSLDYINSYNQLSISTLINYSNEKLMYILKKGYNEYYLKLSNNYLYFGFNNEEYKSKYKLSKNKWFHILIRTKLVNDKINGEIYINTLKSDSFVLNTNFESILQNGGHKTILIGANLVKYKDTDIPENNTMFIGTMNHMRIHYYYLLPKQVYDDFSGFEKLILKNFINFRDNKDIYYDVKQYNNSNYKPIRYPTYNFNIQNLKNNSENVNGGLKFIEDKKYTINYNNNDKSYVLKNTDFTIIIERDIKYVNNDKNNQIYLFSMIDSKSNALKGKFIGFYIENDTLYINDKENTEKIKKINIPLNTIKEKTFNLFIVSYNSDNKLLSVYINNVLIISYKINLLIELPLICLNGDISTNKVKKYIGEIYSYRIYNYEFDLSMINMINNYYININKSKNNSKLNEISNSTYLRENEFMKELFSNYNSLNLVKDYIINKDEENNRKIQELEKPQQTSQKITEEKPQQKQTTQQKLKQQTQKEKPQQKLKQQTQKEKPQQNLQSQLQNQDKQNKQLEKDLEKQSKKETKEQNILKEKQKEKQKELQQKFKELEVKSVLQKRKEEVQEEIKFKENKVIDLGNNCKINLKELEYEIIKKNIKDIELIILKNNTEINTLQTLMKEKQENLEKIVDIKSNNYIKLFNSLNELEKKLHKLFNKQEVLEDKKYCYVKQIDYLNSENINNEQKTFYKELEDKLHEFTNEQCIKLKKIRKENDIIEEESRLSYGKIPNYKKMNKQLNNIFKKRLYENQKFNIKPSNSLYKKEVTNMPNGFQNDKLFTNNINELNNIKQYTKESRKVYQENINKNN